MCVSSSLSCVSASISFIFQFLLTFSPSNNIQGECVTKKLMGYGFSGKESIGGGSWKSLLISGVRCAQGRTGSLAQPPTIDNIR